MLCAISGEAPLEPVLSKKSGQLYEKNLIEKYVEENGTEPGTNEVLSLDDLIPVKSARIVRPRPPTLTSIPALLAAFQNEWDGLALQVFGLEQEIGKLRKELANALYQNDAAVRVIARLTRERDEARASLAKVTVAGSASAANGDEMAIDSTEALPEEFAEAVDATHKKLSKGRKKRSTPKDWTSVDEVRQFTDGTTTDSAVAEATSLAAQGAYAAIAGLKGGLAIYSIAEAQVERSLKVDEPITDALWSAAQLVLATAKGSVKVFENGKETASFSDHAGAVTGVAMHPAEDVRLAASVGADKGIVFYDLANYRRIGRAWADSALTCGQFHPDGHLFAAGTVSGDIIVYTTKDLEQAARFTLGAPVQALAFSENGFWFAATAKGESTVAILDLRKEGDAAIVKRLECGGQPASLAWDYSGQFLAAAGAGSVTVHAYDKSAKAWSEAFQRASTAVAVRWGEKAARLLAVNREGVVTAFEAEAEG